MIDEVWLISLTARSPAIAAVPEGEKDMQLGLETLRLSPGGWTGSGSETEHLQQMFQAWSKALNPPPRELVSIL